ncbi:hypothetical protein [Marivita sp. S2033]|uniref:hypothetical protein n=1 Tax=Marivita sp. S2033 TaxID=3373187 RepID=UPI003981A56B
MSGAMKTTLALIAVVMFGMVASFIWFVANWDKDAEASIVLAPVWLLTEERIA